MDIQLFATDEELQDFPENKTDSTVPDKTPKTNSINLVASDLPRSHSHLPRIPSRLPERKIRHRSRRDHRHKSRSKSSVVDWQADLAEKQTHRQVNLAKNPTLQQARTPKYPADRQSARPNDQLEIKQEIQSIGKPIPAAYLSQLVDRPVDLPPPSEAVLPGQPILGSPEIAPPVAHQLEAHQPVLCLPVGPSSRGLSARSSGPIVVVSPSPARLEHARLKPSHPRHSDTSTSASRLARTY